MDLRKAYKSWNKNNPDKHLFSIEKRKDKKNRDKENEK